MRDSMRAHPSVILEGTLRGLVFGLVFSTIFTRAMGAMYSLSFAALVTVLFTAVSALIWRKTEYIFDDNELHVARRTIFARDVRVQYSRLASVNINRSLINRLTGTATLMFNVNSTVNPMMAEAKLCLREDLAEALRNELSSVIFHKEVTVEEDLQVETLANVSNAEIVMHGFLSQSTLQLLFGTAMLAYSILQLVYNDGRGIILPLIMFILSEAYPVARIILKYFNYRIYRVGDTVTVESGLFTTYRSSFRIGKVNSVRIRQPLVARVLGMATLEAEVIGIAGQEKMPLLCPLKPKAEVDSLLGKLLPEFDIPVDEVHEPRSALFPTSVSALASAAASVIGILALLFVMGKYDLSHMDELACYAVLAGLAGFAAAMLVRAVLLHRNRAIMLGEDILVMDLGGYDTSREYFLYDKVQIAGTRAGPASRRRGLSRCRIGMISATGKRSVVSGIFDDAVSSRVQDIVMNRIRDGRYDYRRYQRFAAWRSTPCRGPSGP